MWTDSHCHLPYEGLEDVDAVVAQAVEAGVDRMISVGTDAAQSRAAIQAAAANARVWATVGLHPHDAKQGVETITPLLAESRVVAIGECGLDFHYDHSPRDVQRAAFAAQIQLAHEHDLALVIHTREAWTDTFDILRAERMPERTVFHCFTGGPEEAKEALEMGAHLSFSGIVTFKGAPEVREAAALCPSDRLLVETDSPYLAPQPHRGKRNVPAFVPLVGAGVAAAQGVDVADVELVTAENAVRVFRLQ